MAWYAQLQVNIYILWLRLNAMLFLQLFSFVQSMKYTQITSFILHHMNDEHSRGDADSISLNLWKPSFSETTILDFSHLPVKHKINAYSSIHCRVSPQQFCCQLVWQHHGHVPLTRKDLIGVTNLIIVRQQQFNVSSMSYQHVSR